MKTFLHIGMPKTGTTALQRHLFPKLAPHLRYNDRLSLRVLKGAVDLQSFGLLTDAFRAQMRALLDRGAQEEGTRFISLEHLSWGLGSNTWDERADLLHHLCPEAEIIITLRHQPSLACSAWLQAVQLGSLCSAEDYFALQPDGSLEDFDLHALQREPSARLHTVELFDFARLYTSFAARFGAHRLHVSFLEAQSLAQLGAQIIERVCPGLDLALPDALPTANVSLSQEALRLSLLRVDFLRVFGVTQVSSPLWFDLRQEALSFRHWLQTMGGQTPDPVPSYSLQDELRFASPESAQMASRLPELFLNHRVVRGLLQDTLPAAAQEASYPLTKARLSPRLHQALLQQAQTSNARLAQLLAPASLPALYLEPASPAQERLAS